MFTSGCCAVSVAPPVCTWVRSIHDRGSCALKRSRMIFAHMRLSARYLATSSRKLFCVLKIQEMRGPMSSIPIPRSSDASM